MNEPIELRNLQIEDIPAAMEFVLSEGWNQTEKDWMLFINDPLNVCKAAEIDGKLVGTTTSVNFSNEVIWISMVLVDKEYRGRRISTVLFGSVLAELKDCKSIKLDATPAGQSAYKKFGFFDEYQILEIVNPLFEGLSVTNSDTLPQKIRKEDIPAIAALDKRAFGTDRSVLIQYLVNEFPEKSWMIKRNNDIAGYALGRKGNKYHRIGPVSASSLEDARILINHALRNLNGKEIVIDILEDKNELTDWLGTLGFTKKRYFTRMFHNNNPFPGKVNLQYLIAGPEFG